MAQRSFFELVRVHEALDECFLLHQEALVTGELPHAAVLFADYRDLLHLHIHHEDNILLPVFARNGRMKRWPPELYTGEHDKLKGFLRRSEAGLQKLIASDDVKPRDLVAQIDLEGGLKRLLDHHDQREQENLFPILDEVTLAAERQQLLDQCLGEWRTRLAESAFPSSLM